MWFNEDAKGSLDSVTSADVEPFMHRYPASDIVTLCLYVTGGFCKFYHFVSWVVKHEYIELNDS